jgi:hypothetical protein
MKTGSVVVLVGISLFLAGCFGRETPIQITTVEETLSISRVDRPRPLILNDVAFRVSFRVISASNLESFVNEYSDGRDQSWFMITPKGYEALSLNMAELRRYIEAQNQIIVYYESITKAK